MSEESVASGLDEMTREYNRERAERHSCGICKARRWKDHAGWRKAISVGMKLSWAERKRSDKLMEELK